MSLDHNVVTASAPAGPTMSDRLLDAARESVLAVGWRRTTLTDVAQRAGVSRMTVYRTYADMTTLLADLMTREWAEVVAVAGDEGGSGDDWPDRIAARVVGTVAALRRDALFRQAVDLDPEWLLPYLIERRGRSQDALLDLLAARVAEGQADGGLRAGDPVLLARGVVLAAHGFLLSAHTMADDDAADGAADGAVGVGALDQELAALVGRYLTP